MRDETAGDGRAGGDGRPMRIMALKAFGDLVIARTALRRADAADAADRGLILGEHLLELHEALGPFPGPVHIVRHGEGGVPAAFDARRKGYARALRSLVALRRHVASAGVPADALLVFDRSGPRERFLAAGRPRRALEAAGPNVYAAYAALLGGGVPAGRTARGRPRSLGIFPSSRIERKNMPEGLVAEMLGLGRSLGIPTSVFLLAGERPELERCFPEARIVPRRFAAMRDAVASVDAVVSSDSMPAHMAEWLDRPVFVLSPVDNRYWMPLSSFAMAEWTLFDDPGRQAKVAQFLGGAA